jgi:hypothetical protein
MAEADIVTNCDNTSINNDPLWIEIADKDGGKTEYEKVGTPTTQIVYVEADMNTKRITLIRKPDGTAVLQQQAPGLPTPIVVRFVDPLPNPGVMPVGGGAAWAGGRLVEYRMKKYTLPSP